METVFVVGEPQASAHPARDPPSVINEEAKEIGVTAGASMVVPRATKAVACCHYAPHVGAVMNTRRETGEAWAGPSRERPPCTAPMAAEPASRTARCRTTIDRRSETSRNLLTCDRGCCRCGINRQGRPRCHAVDPISPCSQLQTRPAAPSIPWRLFPQGNPVSVGHRALRVSPLMRRSARAERRAEAAAR